MSLFQRSRVKRIALLSCLHPLLPLSTQSTLREQCLPFALAAHILSAARCLLSRLVASLILRSPKFSIDTKNFTCLFHRKYRVAGQSQSALEILDSYIHSSEPRPLPKMCISTQYVYRCHHPASYPFRTTHCRRTPAHNPCLRSANSTDRIRFTTLNTACANCENRLRQRRFLRQGRLNATIKPPVSDFQAAYPSLVRVEQVDRNAVWEVSYTACLERWNEDIWKNKKRVAGKENDHDDEPVSPKTPPPGMVLAEVKEVEGQGEDGELSPKGRPEKKRKSECRRLVERLRSWCHIGLRFHEVRRRSIAHPHH